MVYVLTFRGETFDPSTLTLEELEQVEQIAGHGYGDVDPLARVTDFAALLTVFLLRTLDSDAAMAIVADCTLADINVTVA